MKNKKITINKTEIDIKEIDNLLNQNRKLEAIKFVCDKTNIGLQEGKVFIENIQTGKYDNLPNPIIINDNELINNNESENQSRSDFKNLDSKSIEPEKSISWKQFVVLGIILIGIAYYFYSK